MIGGACNHTTGTDSDLLVKDKLSQKTLNRTLIASAIASAEYPLFNTEDAVYQSVFSWFLLDDTMEMLSTSLGTGAFFNVEVLEFTT